ncbi:DUF29 domain-containing protein [Methylopila sp. M107]|uniref:DUF29 domain-containing protein n=1 Tax=Methylopila sp. M107 TaxID=1101190 RepID=UPI000368285E|nr:DUF29 domain-containing protein [Methylopila sp. M107]
MVAKVKDRPKARAAYEDDFSAWLNEQAALIRSGRVADIDAENVAEELEGIARSEFRSLISALTVLILHMLKWDHQPERRSSSWISSINEQRDQFDLILEDNPSFKPRLPDALQKAHRASRRRAVQETGLSLASFPETCPYDWDELLTRAHDVSGLADR